MDESDETTYAPGKCTPEMLAYLAEVDAHNEKMRVYLHHHRWVLSTRLWRDNPPGVIDHSYLGRVTVVGSRGWDSKRPTNHLESDLDFAIVAPKRFHYEVIQRIFAYYGRETRMTTKVHDMSPPGEEVELISHFSVYDERVKKDLGSGNVDIVLLSHSMYDKESERWAKRFPLGGDNEEERAWYVFQMAKFRREGSIDKHRAMKHWLTANL